jgi:hypothetical protein
LRWVLMMRLKSRDDQGWQRALDESAVGVNSQDGAPAPLQSRADGAQATKGRPEKPLERACRYAYVIACTWLPGGVRRVS